MKNHWALFTFTCILVFLVQGTISLLETQNHGKSLVKREDVGTARTVFPYYFPWLPQFRGIDLGERFNSIKEPEDTGFFMTRDTLAFIFTNISWLLIHALTWNGKITRTSQLPFPFNLLTIFFGGRRPEDEGTFFPEGIDELDLNGLINFYTNPSTATRNLYLAGGFSMFALILWIVPTFFWTGTPLPTRQTQKKSRFLNIIQHVRSDSNAVEIYNQLMCPQCILIIMSINFLVLMGRWIFWSILSSLPDLPSFGVPRSKKRSFSNEEDEMLSLDTIRSLVDDFFLSVELRVDTIVHDIEKREGRTC